MQVLGRRDTLSRGVQVSPVEDTMARHTTRKGSSKGKAETLRRKAIRSDKYRVTMVGVL